MNSAATQNTYPNSGVVVPQYCAFNVEDNAQHLFWALNRDKTRYELINDKDPGVVWLQEVSLSFADTNVFKIKFQGRRVLIYLKSAAAPMCIQMRTFEAAETSWVASINRLVGSPSQRLSLSSAIPCHRAGLLTKYRSKMDGL